MRHYRIKWAIEQLSLFSHSRDPSYKSDVKVFYGEYCIERCLDSMIATAHDLLKTLRFVALRSSIARWFDNYLGGHFKVKIT